MLLEESHRGRLLMQLEDTVTVIQGMIESIELPEKVSLHSPLLLKHAVYAGGQYHAGVDEEPPAVGTDTAQYTV